MTVCEAPPVTGQISDLVAPHRNILLVDEDHSDCALFGIAVEKSDLNIWLQTVTDGGRATDYLEGRGDFGDRVLHPLPDLIVLDLDLRLTGGLEFLEWLRASTRFSQLPVVLFSSFAYRGAIDTALSMGAKLFIAKPGATDGWVGVIRNLWEITLANDNMAGAGI
jgi:CheY-like chemotaxis protein